MGLPCPPPTPSVITELMLRDCVSKMTSHRLLGPQGLQMQSDRMAKRRDAGLFVFLPGPKRLAKINTNGIEPFPFYTKREKGIGSENSYKLGR